MTSTGANTAAIAAALTGSGPPVTQHNRQSWTLKGNGGARISDVTMKSGNGVGPNEIYVDDDDVMQDGDAVADGMPDGRAGDRASKARIRRASEGAYLSKSEGKRSSGELRCEKCGKGYKHSSCLTKHLSVPCVLPSFTHWTRSVLLFRPCGRSRRGLTFGYRACAFSIPTNLGV